jgi:hypothetical protein
MNTQATDEEILSIASVLQSRGVDVDKILQAHMQDRSTKDQILWSLVGVLYDGLAYGNWPVRSAFADNVCLGRDA